MRVSRSRGNEVRLVNFLNIDFQQLNVGTWDIVKSSDSREYTFWCFYPARVTGRVLYLTRFFFFLLLLSSFWQHIFFTYFPTLDFIQTWSKWPVPWPLLRHRQWWRQGSRWGHWGQKGHFHHKGIKSYRIPSIDAWLTHMHKLHPLYKSYSPKNSSGVI